MFFDKYYDETLFWVFDINFGQYPITSQYVIFNRLKRFERTLSLLTRQVNNIANTPGIYRIFVKRVLILFHRSGLIIIVKTNQSQQLRKRWRNSRRLFRACGWTEENIKWPRSVLQKWTVESLISASLMRPLQEWRVSN